MYCIIFESGKARELLERMTFNACGLEECTCISLDVVHLVAYCFWQFLSDLTLLFLFFVFFNSAVTLNSTIVLAVVMVTVAKA